MNVYWDEARKTAEYDHDHYHDQFYCVDDLMTLMTTALKTARCRPFTITARRW